MPATGRPLFSRSRTFPTNLGGLCSKGWNATDLLDHPQRLLTPLVRSVPGDRTSPFRPATWDEALDADRHRDPPRRRTPYGPDGVGCFGGGGLTNEKAYAFGKFARVALRTTMIDYNGRFCMSSAATAGNRAFGIDRGLPFPLADLAEADTILLVGSNPAATMPPAMQFFDAGRAAGAHAHRRRPAAHRHRRRLDACTSQPLPGTDLALANGMLHIAIREGRVDDDYVAQRTKGFAACRPASPPTGRTGSSGSPASRSRPAGDRAPWPRPTDGDDPDRPGRRAAQLGHRHGAGLHQPRPGARAAGQAGVGYGTITGQGNGQGGREHGQKADQLPGYRKLADPRRPRARRGGLGHRPGTSSPSPGSPRSRCSTGWARPAASGRCSCWPPTSPSRRRTSTACIDRLEALDLLVVSDIFLSETAELADVVLPTAQWAEEEGTMTNLEGRVIRRRRALPPPDGVLDDLRLLKELADRLGRGQLLLRRSARGLRRAAAGPVPAASPTTPASRYERIDAEQGVFWPCPDARTIQARRGSSPTASRPRTGGPASSGSNTASRTRVPDADYPYVLTTGRLMAQYQSGTQTRRVPSPSQAQVQPEAQLHPDLARRLDIGERRHRRSSHPGGAAPPSGP